MKILTKKSIIKDQNHAVQIILHGIFTLVGVGIGVSSISSIVMEDMDIMDKVFLVLMMSLFPILFGYVLGVRPLVPVLKDIKKFKSNGFYILKRKIIDKDIHYHINRNNDGNNYPDTELKFANKENVWVLRHDGKKYKPGNYVYVGYFNGDSREKPVFVYDVREVELDYDLKQVLKEE